MIEREIKDTDKYEAKLIGPLSARQTIWGAIGIAVAIAGFFITRSYLGDAAFFVAALLAAPFMLCGFYKPHNIPFEKYIKSVFISMFIAPTKRKYKTENTYDLYFYEKTENKKTKNYVSKDESRREV